MRSFHRSAQHSLTCVLAGALWFAGCSLSGFSEKGNLDGFVPGNDSGTIVFDAAAHDAKGDHGELIANPLCGDGVTCGFPDDVGACEGFDAGFVGSGGTTGSGGAPGTEAGSGGTTGTGSGGMGGALDAGLDGSPRDGGPDASDGASDASDAESDGGDAASVPDGGSSGSAVDGSPGGASSTDASGHADGASGDSMTPPTYAPRPDVGPAFACQVVSGYQGRPVHQCVTAGPGKVGDPCSGSSDCRAGLACVGKAGAGQCRPYCCKSSTECAPERSGADGSVETRTYCGERPLLEGSGKESTLHVPVCIPADDCRLEEEYPCTSAECTCLSGTACSIVRDSPTSYATTCVKPGESRLGEPCPCAWGYFCSEKSQECVKICRTNGADNACDPGVCQATAGFPDGFGLCVGLAPLLK